LSNVPQGPGWWLASDQRWYPPELHPDAPTGSRLTTWSIRFACAGLGIILAAAAYVGALPNPDCVTNCPKVDPHHVYAAIGFLIFGVFAGASILSIIVGLVSVNRHRRPEELRRARNAIILGIIDVVLVMFAGLAMAFMYALATNPNVFQF